MSIDWGKVITPTMRDDAARAEALRVRKQECRDRILAVANLAAQQNMAAAAAIGLMDAYQMQVYIYLIAWITVMREVAIDPAAEWPVPHPDIAALVKEY